MMISNALLQILVFIVIFGGLTASQKRLLIVQLSLHMLLRLDCSTERQVAIFDLNSNSVSYKMMR